MIRANFKVKKIENDKKNDEQRKFESLIEKSGVGSHMVFRSSKDDDDEFFIEEL